MTITLRKPESEEYRLFSDAVKERAMKEYNEALYGDDEAIYSSIYNFNIM